MDQQQTTEVVEQQPLSGSQTSESPEVTSEVVSSNPNSEKTLDEILEGEQEQIAKLDEANKEEAAAEETEGEPEDEEGDETAAEDGAEFKPNLKYKVKDEEFEIDKKYHALIQDKESEALVRDLSEKAHGLNGIKETRDKYLKERDEVRGNLQNLASDVGRILNYKRAGDLQSFFESVQLDDNAIAAYILEKARIAGLPPEEKAAYTEREALRRRVNAAESTIQSLQTSNHSSEGQARLNELDQTIGSEKYNGFAKDFDARNGAGSFKNAILNFGHMSWLSSGQKTDLTVPEAIEGFVKTMGLSIQKPSQKVSADPTKRVVSRPKVKTIPNYGGGQASVTATQKPKSVADLRKISKEKYGS